MDINAAVELLRSAEINCDNVPKLGRAGFSIVKMQIQQALKALDASLMTEDVEESLNG